MFILPQLQGAGSAKLTLSQRADGKDHPLPPEIDWVGKGLSVLTWSRNVKESLFYCWPSTESKKSVGKKGRVRNLGHGASIIFISRLSLNSNLLERSN